MAAKPQRDADNGDNDAATESDDGLASVLGAGGGASAEGEFIVDGAGGASKRGGVVILLLIAVAAGGAYLMYAKGGPRVARAATPEAAAAQAEISAFLAGGSKDIAGMQDLLRDTEKVVRQFLDYPAVRQVPLSQLRTDPFRLTTAAASAATSAEASLAEARRAHEQARAAALARAQKLKLQSVMMGRGKPVAMIDGRAVSVGDTLDNGILVEQIRPGAVVIRDGNFRFQLQLDAARN
jgi:hypothetical protein